MVHVRERRPSFRCTVEPVKLSELGEDGFLARLRDRLPAPGPAVVLGLGDDTAVLDLPQAERTLVTTDVLVEGVHFLRRTLPPRFIGRKAVAVNASDIAAMGGRPVGILMSLMTPAESSVSELMELFDGLIERASGLGADLVGGNLCTSPGPLAVDVTIVGASRRGRIMERRGARPGDAIYVSGKLGASAEGLRLLNEGVALAASGSLIVPNSLRSGPLPLAEQCLRAHIDPEPRLELGAFLCENEVATACIDLSDGLARDLHRLCRASGVGSRIEESALPVHPGVLAWEGLRKRPPLDLALAGGEDYELLFTVRKEGLLERWRQEGSVPITRIGEVIDSREGIRLATREGSERSLEPAGWDHFLPPSSQRGA